MTEADFPGAVAGRSDVLRAAKNAAAVTDARSTAAGYVDAAARDFADGNDNARAHAGRDANGRGRSNSSSRPRDNNKRPSRDNNSNRNSRNRRSLFRSR